MVFVFVTLLFVAKLCAIVFPGIAFPGAVPGPVQGPVPVTLSCVRPDGGKLVPFSDTVLTVTTADGRTVKQGEQPNKDGSVHVFLIPGSYALFWTGGNTSLPFDVSPPETTITVTASPTTGDLKSLLVKPQSKSPADASAKAPDATEAKPASQVHGSAAQPGDLTSGPKSQGATQGAPTAQPSTSSAQAASNAGSSPPIAASSQQIAPSTPQPSVPAAVSNAATPLLIAPLLDKPPDHCTDSAKFRLAESEILSITVSETKYYIFLKQVENPGDYTAKIYVVASNDMHWNTKKVSEREFLNAVKALQEVPDSSAPLINNDAYGILELDKTSEKKILTPSGHRLWITVKPNYVLRHADFTVCVQ